MREQAGKKVTVGSPEAKETLQFLFDLGKRQAISPLPRISTSPVCTRLSRTAGAVAGERQPLASEQRMDALLRLLSPPLAIAR